VLHGHLLLRHAETDGNATRVVQLPAALSERGKCQRRLAGGRRGRGITASLQRPRPRPRRPSVRATTGAPIEIDPAPPSATPATCAGRRQPPHRDIFGPDYEPRERPGPRPTPAWTMPGSGCCASRPRPRDTSRSHHGPSAGDPDRHLGGITPEAAPDRWGNTAHRRRTHEPCGPAPARRTSTTTQRVKRRGRSADRPKTGPTDGVKPKTTHPGAGPGRFMFDARNRPTRRVTCES
jgi:hypothetical protein